MSTTTLLLLPLLTSSSHFICYSCTKTKYSISIHTNYFHFLINSLLNVHLSTQMFRHRETNPYFLQRNNDPVIEFPSQQIQPQPRPTPPNSSHALVDPPYNVATTQPPPQLKIPQSNQDEAPPQPHQAPPHTQPLPAHPGRPHHHHGSALLHVPTSQRTRPVAWLVAAFCALFWMIIIIGGLIVLIVYLVFRPRNPRFDISTVTLNAAYLDMGYLLNADVTVLANFSNPNTKVNVDFSYVILDLYHENNFIATRYIEPFSVRRRESRFADVHMVSSQVRLSMGQSLELQRQMESGRVNFEIRGLFKTRSKLGIIFHYSYYLYAHCQIAVTGPPTGVMIAKRCATKR